MVAAALILLVASALAVSPAPHLVSFPAEDGGTVQAHLYEGGDHWVVLVHGGRFDKESWCEQAQALAGAGLAAFAIGKRPVNPPPPAYSSQSDHPFRLNAITGAKRRWGLGAPLLMVFTFRQLSWGSGPPFFSLKSSESRSPPLRLWWLWKPAGSVGGGA